MQVRRAAVKTSDTRLKDSERKYFCPKPAIVKLRKEESTEMRSPGRAFASTNSSPFANKTMTPKLKMSEGKKFGLMCQPETEKSLKRWNTITNSFQQRMMQLGLGPSSVEKGAKQGSADLKRGRSSNKENSLNMKKRNSKSKKQNRSKKISKFEECVTEGLSPLLLKFRDENKENMSPNIMIDKSQKLARTKMSLDRHDTASPSYQMFSNFLKSIEMTDPTSSPKVKMINKPDTAKAEAINPMTMSVQSLAIPDECARLMLKIGILTAQIKVSFESGADIYELIREYVDLAQEEGFKKLQKCLDSKPGVKYLVSVILQALKLERWAIMTVFYFSFSAKEIQASAALMLQNLLRICVENTAVINQITMRAGPTSDHKLEASKKHFFKNTLGTDAGSMSSRSLEVMLKDNCNKLQEKIMLCAKLGAGDNAKPIKAAMKFIPLLALPIATERCFEVYYAFLRTKQVISMETLEEVANQSDTAVLVCNNLDQDNTIDLIRNKTDSGKKSNRKIGHSNSKKAVFDCEEKTIGSMTKPSEISPNKKDFLELLEKLENESVETDSQLFHFQPVLNGRNDKLKIPYLPPMVSDSPIKYTLALDLDETLVHFEENDEQSGGQFHVRPYAVDFLKQMAKYYEIVIFTAAIQKYADWILDRIDEGGVISHRLYREHTNQQNNIFLKDLTNLGRDIRKCIIVDNHAENFQCHPENGIFIKSWYGDTNDQALARLAPILKEISMTNCGDLRVALAKLKEAMARNPKRAASPLRD